MMTKGRRNTAVDIHAHDDVWRDACMQEHGCVLTGEFTHFCADHDPARCMDETCPEWPCTCFAPPKRSDIMWAIVSQNHGFYVGTWLTAGDAKAYHSWNQKRPWVDCEAAGDRCVRVQVTEI